MIGKKCIHIETGQEGIIKDEMKASTQFPEQWGIYWTFRYNSSIPNHYYWNDKDKIKLL